MCRTRAQPQGPLPITCYHQLQSHKALGKRRGLGFCVPFCKNNSPCPPCSGIRGKEARGGRDTGMRIVRGLWDVAHGGSALASREQGGPICYQGFESRNPLTRSNRSTCCWLKIRYWIERRKWPSYQWVSRDFALGVLAFGVSTHSGHIYIPVPPHKWQVHWQYFVKEWTWRFNE